MRRWTTPMVAVLAIAAFALVLVGSAQAKGIKEKVKTDKSFELTSEQCSNLPAGTVIDGTGKSKSTTITENNADGTTTISNHETVRGEATDQDGNTYKFFYDNSFTVSNSAADPGTFSGIMNDFFSLDPKGQSKHGGAPSLENGFKAVFTTNFSDVFHFDEISSFGDPLDFSAGPTNGTAHCDPL